MVNPAIEFGWSENARDAPTTWTPGEWVDLPPATVTALRDDVRLHVDTREVVYVPGIRAFVDDVQQDSSTARVVVAPAELGLAAGPDGQGHTHWLWCRVTGVRERPVHPLGPVRVYGTPTPTP